MGTANAVAVQLGAQDVNAMCGDSHQNIYATGSFIGNVDFDPGPGMFICLSTQVEIILTLLKWIV